MRNIFILILVLSLGLLGGWFANKMVGPDAQPGTPQTISTEKESAIEHAEKHLSPGYVCPMHPSVVSNEPSNCPICGMTLEAKTLNTNSADQPGIAISPAMSNSLGVRIVHVEMGRISEQVFASGNVETVTPKTTTDIKLKINGKVKQVFAKVGDWVAEGDFILSVEAPDFTKLQTDFLATIKAKDYKTMAELRKKLAALEPRKAVLDGVDRINHSELTPEFIVEAPHSGILEWSLEQGADIKQGTQVARVVTKNLARVRLRSYARAARAVKRGRHAQLDLPHIPGLYWPGRVIEVDHGDAGFYSTIQADFEVPDRATEEGVFVGAYVNAGTNAEALRVPTSAIIRVENESRVVRLRQDGQFEPTRVETGFIGAEWAEIKSGLVEGDAVVMRAQFLIDSEATLRAGFSRISE